MSVVTFNHLDRADYHASIVDINRNGVGIESNSRAERGFVWFRNPIWGQQSGVLLWSKQVGTRYRSGIRFASLPNDTEAFVINHIACTQTHEPFKDLEKIIKMMIEYIKGDTDFGRGMIGPRGEDRSKSWRQNNKD